MTEDLTKLASALRDIKFTMFTTTGEDGSLFSRPMATLEIDERNFDGKLWFFTDKNSPKVNNISAGDGHVNLAYADPKKEKYISVSGRASLVHDKEMIRRLWKPVMKAWFPEGVDDPNIALLCVEVESAELWDSPPSKVVQLVGMMKATATGQRYNGEKYQHHIDVKGHH
jgi:general stress protein 26